MQNITRRQLFIGSSLAGVASLLVACTPPSTTTTPATTASTVDTVAQQGAKYALLLANGLAALGPVLVAENVSAATVQLINGYAASAATDAQTIANAVVASVTPNTSTVQEIESIVEKVAPLVLSFVPGGSAAIGIINAVTAVAPSLGTAFGIAGAALKIKSPLSVDAAIAKLSALPKSRFLA